MEYYSRRNGMRSMDTPTYKISSENYSLLYRCCKRYFSNIAWKYRDSTFTTKIDINKLNLELELEIPELYRNSNREITEIPNEQLILFKMPSIFQDRNKFCVYSILDLIEFMSAYIRDYTCQSEVIKYPPVGVICLPAEIKHKFLLSSSSKSFIKFKNEINLIFEKKSLLYRLNDDRKIERVIENSPLSEEVENAIIAISEPRLKELLREAVELFRLPKFEDGHLAVEKIWDAFERLKTYYSDLNKKASADKIVHEISNEQQEFIDLFNSEFEALTKIGNNFSIRHHETNKIEIRDPRHYDYFFNRCLSLIAHAIQYLK